MTRFAAFSPIRNVLLGCLFLLLLVFLAAPVQSQAPTELPCGQSVTLTAATTYVMTADCEHTQTRITISSGTVTLNGNGHTISGSTRNRVFIVTGSSTVFNLNDITISDSGVSGGRIIQVNQGATLNARNVILSGNTSIPITFHDANTAGTLTNARFLNNGPILPRNLSQSLAVYIGSGDIEVTINGAAFIGNSGERPTVIRVIGGTLNLRGCIRASGNTGPDGAAASLVTTNAGTVNNNSRCPKPKRKTPTPTATARPPAVTCPALSQATGIVIHAAYGLDSGIQCQRLDGGGIGVQALAENHIAAVDIWGYVEQGVEVCFPQAGRIIFLDARMSPREMMLMPPRISGDMTCASIDVPGSLVLLPPE